ncbi:MAG TPA: nucleotide exchange factor GrpE [Acidimicrobiia bacterium]|nr:nucleotide exchange factor GrpE [Acidimicrobiia bacterium]
MTENQENQTEVFEAEVVLDESEARPSAEDLGLDLPDDPDEAIDVLLLKVKEARDEATSYLDDLRRVAADFDNYRRRSTREQGETTQRAAERIVTELLPALDTLDAAAAVETTTESEKKLLAGMHRTRDQILTILRAQGLEVVPTLGEPFDPEMHEPVMSPSEGSGKLVVSDELRRGYRLRERLIRPALVALEFEDQGR